MIVQAIKQLEIQRVGDTDEGIQAGISEDSLPFIFDMVSRQLYSNPIGAVVREITSNCFDSHVEAKVDEPVIISKTHNIEEGYSIEFKDVGIGMSTERIANIYMKYFTSTKRGDNTQIGAWGLGSKTPLAYADMFYITTIFDNIKYEYIFHKGESKPTLELLNQEETTEHNGTTIKIVIEGSRDVGYDSRNDTNKFKNELLFQLAYFDSVYFMNWGISNDYDIYEGEYFKFRSDIEQKNTNIHICLGKVRYPIDFSKVDIANKYRQIPIAVKFEIGELKITPSRESLRYEEQEIQLIQKRVELAVNEIMALFEKQNPVIEDLETFERKKTESPRITFNEERNHVLTLWSASGLSKNFIFKPLTELNIKKIPDNFFFMWECKGYLNGEIFRNADSYSNKVDNNFILKSKYVILGKDDKMSSYTNIYIRRTLGGSYNSIYFIKRKELDYDYITKLLGIKETKTIGKAKTILEYLKIINQIVFSKGQRYEDLRATDEWIAEYKRSIIESTAAYIRKKNQKVFVRNIGNNSRGEEMSVLKLQNRTGILIYGFKEDKGILQRIYETIRSNVASIRNLNHDKIEKALIVIQISRSVEKDIIGAKKTIYWDKIFNTKLFRTIITHREIFKGLQNLELSALNYRRQFLRGFAEDYDRIKANIINYNLTSSNRFMFRDLDYDHEVSIDKNLLKPIEEFEKKYSYDIPLINFITSLNGDEEKEFADYLKYKGFKLRNRFYLKDVEQLKYEAGIMQILRLFKCPQNNLLTYNLNLQENGNENSINSKEDRSEHNSDHRQEEVQQESLSGGDNSDLEESRDV